MNQEEARNEEMTRCIKAFKEAFTGPGTLTLEDFHKAHITLKKVLEANPNLSEDEESEP